MAELTIWVHGRYQCLRFGIAPHTGRNCTWLGPTGLVTMTDWKTPYGMTQNSDHEGFAKASLALSIVVLKGLNRSFEVLFMGGEPDAEPERSQDSADAFISHQTGGLLSRKVIADDFTNGGI